MQPDLWKKVEELYHAALAKPPDERPAFLAQACPDDALVRAEVQALLDQKAASFLEGAPMSAVLALGAGARLGNFEIVGLLGRGGMGQVYRARDSRLKREVAIKTLPPLFAADRDRIARFEREARAASALNHPNIVTVYDVGRENGVSFIVSELVEGETLARVIERGPLPLRKLIEVGTQIAEGLAAAHAAGVVHRDLKPGNVMLTSGGRVKILDFGLARQDRVLGPESTTVAVSDAGAILGTPGYMSPEQVRGEPADARSDLFSLGLILYEMASGKPAFQGGSSIEVMNSILKDDPPELPPASPPALDRIVRRCIEKQPAMRFQSASDLGFALGSVSGPQAATAPARKRRPWPLWTAAAALGLALGIGGAAWWLRAPAPLPSTLPEASLRRLTKDGGLSTDAAISPDGKLVAYASDRTDSSNLDIWVQQVDGGGAVRITDDPADDYAPAFSPDGTQIAFRSDREGGGIYVVPALGGEARLRISRGSRPRFSPDGQMMMYSLHANGASGLGGDLFIQRDPAGAPVQIGAGCVVLPDSAVWSPDSRRVLFWAACGSGRNTYQYPTLWVSTLDGKSVAGPTLSDSFAINQWLPGPSRLLVTVPLSDGSSIATVPVSADGTTVTGQWQRLTLSTGGAWQPSAARNGRIALSAMDWESHNWGIPIDGNGHATGPPRRLTARPAGEYETFPVLSRDGKNLAFLCSWVDRAKLYYRNLATGKEREIASDIVLWTGVSFSPDARTVLYAGQQARSAGAETSVYEVPVSGGVPRKVWNESTGVNIWDWSPDGTTILYNPWETNHSLFVEKDLKSLSKTTFVADPEYDVWQAHFSNDGRWVTFNGTKDGRSRVYVVPFRKALVPRSEWIPVTDGQWDDKPRFAHNDKLIFFISTRDGFRCTWAQRLGPDMHPAGSPFAVYHCHQRSRTLGASIVDLQMDVGPNMIVFNQVERTGQIWLLEPAKHDAR
jgi:Tol biopolymer transport system component